jgi:hypothetical protein
MTDCQVVTFFLMGFDLCSSIIILVVIVMILVRKTRQILVDTQLPFLT